MTRSCLKLSIKSVLGGMLLFCLACSENEADPSKDGGKADIGGGGQDSKIQFTEGGGGSDIGNVPAGGTKFVYLGSDKKSVKSLSIDGCTVTDLYTIETDKEIGKISISPDGKWFFYGLSLDDGVAVDLTSKNKVTLVAPGAGEVYWAQDNSKIITGWHTYGGGQIFELPSGTPLFEEPTRIEHPSFISNDGKVLYTNSNAWIMDLSTKEAAVVFNGCGRTSSSMDGKMMCSKFMAKKELAIFFDEAGVEKSQIELGENLDIKPAQKPMVTPDGSKIIWGQSEAGQIVIYAIAADGQGAKVKLTSGVNQAAFLYPSWDGKYLAWSDKIISLADGAVVCQIDKSAQLSGGFTR